MVLFALFFNLTFLEGRGGGVFTYGLSILELGEGCMYVCSGFSVFTMGD